MPNIMSPQRDLNIECSMGTSFKRRILVIYVTFIISGYSIKAQTLKDIDGNVYKTVTIGSQVWMKENLKVTHYRNGDSIQEVQDSLSWVVQSTGAWCNNENKTSNGNIYGKLYNWYVVNDPRKISPLGWHVPTDQEWKILEMYVGMSLATADLENYRGTKEANALKLADTTTYWTLDCCPTPGLQKNKGTNSSGFSAIGGGYRIYFNAGGSYTSFQKPTGNAQFWTSSEADDATAWLRHLCVYHEDIYRAHWPKVNGSSIRLIKDSSPSSFNKINSDVEILIYPNPAIDEFYIYCDKTSYLIMQFFNLQGELVMTKVLKQGVNEIDINYLAKGIYILKLVGPSGTSFKKLIKE